MLKRPKHTVNHPNSYYAASALAINAFPSLTESLDVDVCIIGGGFSGLNTAIDLAERGSSVALLESRKLAWGASGRNGGQLIRGIGHNVAQFQSAIGADGVNKLHAMGFEAVDVVIDRISKYNIDCDLTFGHCELANTKADMALFEQVQQSLDALGYRHKTDYVTADRIHEVVGSNSYQGGLVDYGSGHLHPLNLALGEANVARQLGVKCFEHSHVNSITEGERLKVSTSTGNVNADNVVICGNAYLSDVSPYLEKRVLPAGSYLIATAPLCDEHWQAILPSNMAVSDQKIALDYYRLSADKRLLFGGLCHYSGRDPTSIRKALQPKMLKLFPFLEDVAIDYEWGGMIGIGMNRMPQIGRLSNHVYYAQAYAGHGLNATHLAGRIIAEHIHEQSERIELFEAIRHRAFPGGPALRSPLLAAGMLFERLKSVF